MPIEHWLAGPLLIQKRKVGVFFRLVLFAVNMAYPLHGRLEIVNAILAQSEVP